MISGTFKTFFEVRAGVPRDFLGPGHWLFSQVQTVTFILPTLGHYPRYLAT